jgi:hypothetical protein
MAEFLALGNSDAALGAKSVPGFRMQQIAPTNFTIPLTFFEIGLTMGALGHLDLQSATLRTCVRQAHETSKPFQSQ